MTMRIEEEGSERLPSEFAEIRAAGRPVARQAGGNQIGARTGTNGEAVGWRRKKTSP